MRRAFVPIVAAATLLGVAFPAQATALPTGAHVRGRSIVEWQRTYLDWVLTSSENLVFNPACGQVVDGVYFLPPTIQPGLELECDIPAGVPVLIIPSAAFSEIPTYGATDDAIIADMRATWDLLLFSEAAVDGRPVSLDGVATEAGVYDVGPVEAGSFFDLECEGLPAPCSVDFAPGDMVRLASTAEIVILHPFTPATHTIYFADQFTFFPEPVSLTAKLHVG